jgi:hypothetical protein
MSENHGRYELSREGDAKIKAVDNYLGEAIRDGRPLETLIATRRLGEIINDRAKEAARVATAGSSSWTDVGRALGMSKQAAHEKLRARVRGEIDKGLAQLERAEQAGHDKLTRRAKRGRQGLDRAAPYSPTIDSARKRIDEWEQNQHEKLSGKVEKAREKVAQAEQKVQDKLDPKS